MRAFLESPVLRVYPLLHLRARRTQPAYHRFKRHRCGLESLGHTAIVEAQQCRNPRFAALRYPSVDVFTEGPQVERGRDLPEWRESIRTVIKHLILRVDPSRHLRARRAEFADHGLERARRGAKRAAVAVRKVERGHERCRP